MTLLDRNARIRVYYVSSLSPLCSLAAETLDPSSQKKTFLKDDRIQLRDQPDVYFHHIRMKLGNSLPGLHHFIEGEFHTYAFPCGVYAFHNRRCLFNPVGMPVFFVEHLELFRLRITITKTIIIIARGFH